MNKDNHLKNVSDNKRVAILYIDDEVHNLNSFKATFRREYDVYIAESTKEGRKILGERKIHILLTDQRMPEETGVHFLEGIISEYPDPIRMLITGYADIEVVVDAINKGKVYNYIQKPWHEQELRILLNKAYEIFALREENRELTKSLIQANKQLEFLLRQKLLS